MYTEWKYEFNCPVIKGDHYETTVIIEGDASSERFEAFLASTGRVYEKDGNTYYRMNRGTGKRTSTYYRILGTAKKESVFLEDVWNPNGNEEDDYGYTSSTNHDYSPSNPWDAPGMSIRDFI